MYTGILLDVSISFSKGDRGCLKWRVSSHDTHHRPPAFAEENVDRYYGCEDDAEEERDGADDGEGQWWRVCVVHRVCCRPMV